MQNLLVMRYANPVFSSWWNRNYINNIQITMKEDFGTQVSCGLLAWTAAQQLLVKLMRMGWFSHWHATKA